MRVVECQTYSERRDALSHDWGRFLGVVLPWVHWVPVPNIGTATVGALTAFKVDGLILTGGEDWGVHTERDETETALLRWALHSGVAVLGVCRGAQVINRHFGGTVRPDESDIHCAKRHFVSIRGVSTEVNSFHRSVIGERGMAQVLTTWAYAEDGTVEAFLSESYSVAGVVWHPEREQAPREHDVALFRHIFKRGSAL